MELKPGYKQTEVGLIPEDWGLDEVSAFSRILTGPFGTLLKASEYTDGDGVPQISVGEVGDGYFRVGEHTSRIPPHVVRRLPQYLLRRGDIVFGRKGAVDRSALVTESESGWFLGSDGIVVRPVGDSYPPYLAAQFRSKAVKTWLLSHAIGTTMPSLNQAVLGRVLVPLAPREEQIAIAAALGDVDALLAAQDALIAKKRAIKQGAMQELLIGKRRLPGFSGEWEVLSLDELSTRVAGAWGSGSPDGRRSRFAHVVRAGDITSDGQLVTTATRYFSDEEFAAAKCDHDNLIITTSGNGLGKLWWCDGRENIAASNFVRVIRPKKSIAVGRFLYYALRTFKGVVQLAEHTATSAYPNLRPTYFKEAWIPTPGIMEQIAISDVLSEMDAEITALEAKRAKTAQLKQGMMQALLTGRIRLV